MKPKVKVKVKVNAYNVVSQALEYAVERGMNRHDKYSPEPLTEASRDLLRREIEQSFWLSLDDQGATIS